LRKSTADTSYTVALENIDTVQNLLQAVQGFSAVIHSKQLKPQALFLSDIVMVFRDIVQNSDLSPEFFVQSAGTFLGAALVVAAHCSGPIARSISRPSTALVDARPTVPTGKQAGELSAAEDWLRVARWTLQHLEDGQPDIEGSQSSVKASHLQDRIALAYADVLIRSGSLSQGAAELSTISDSAKAMPASIILMIRVLIEQGRPADIVARAVQELSSKRPSLELLLDTISRVCQKFLPKGIDAAFILPLLRTIQSEADLKGLFLLKHICETCITYFSHRQKCCSALGPFSATPRP